MTTKQPAMFQHGGVDNFKFMKMEKIMQDIFKRLINEIFLLKFKPYGWKKQGSNFRYIDASGLGRVINFQKSKWNTADELEFYAL